MNLKWNTVRQEEPASYMWRCRLFIARHVEASEGLIILVMKLGNVPPYQGKMWLHQVESAPIYGLHVSRNFEKCKRFIDFQDLAVTFFIPDDN